MTRPRPWVTPNTCPTCRTPVWSASRDVLGDVVADLLVDPTPLDRPHRAFCVLEGRRTYRYGVEAGHGWLGDARVVDRSHPGPDVVLPAHQCGRTFPLPQLTVGGASATYPDVPEF